MPTEAMIFLVFAAVMISVFELDRRFRNRNLYNAFHPLALKHKGEIIAATFGCSTRLILPFQDQTIEIQGWPQSFQNVCELQMVLISTEAPKSAFQALCRAIPIDFISKKLFSYPEWMSNQNFKSLYELSGADLMLQIYLTESVQAKLVELGYHLPCLWKFKSENNLNLRLKKVNIDSETIEALLSNAIEVFPSKVKWAEEFSY